MDCGPTCLRIIAKHFGKNISLSKVREFSETTREGSSLKGLSDAAESIGLRSLGVKISYDKLQEEAPLPCIVFWQQKHFVVVYKIKKDTIYVSDPAHGLLQYTKHEFIQNWIGHNADERTMEGVVLLLEPTPKFSKNPLDDDKEHRDLAFLYKYLFRYKRFVVQLIIGLTVVSLLQLIFPFLTQSIVDVGIQQQDMDFIYIIFAAQIFLFLGKSGVEIIRGWILLHLSARINISLVSDFFIKLMNLPISFFDIKMTGDIMQRISDHRRIENLLTNSSLNVLFSMLNLVIFGIVLAWYHVQIFVFFTIGSIAYFVWIILFLKKRKDLDYKRFSQVSAEQSKVIELINGMQEIKMHNAEKQKRWSWEYLQARLFRVDIQSLSLEQSQQVGGNFINELKNIFITIFAAKLVIEGQLTLGMMLSISYILGQLNGPITQMVNFLHTIQDAKIALERLSEIHNKADEELKGEEKISDISANDDLVLDDISFRYLGSGDYVIQNLSAIITSQRTTAIVGASGSGKTTLMKLLLKFYDPSVGDIKLGNYQLLNISQKTWRDHCGVVMQEGYIFNDTIADNIAIGAAVIDKEKLYSAVEVANIRNFIESLPLAYNTKIGMEGIGLSTGQKQRILIARAVYKNPDFIFFDEATSALDARNEKIIMNNLNAFFKGRTAIVIAHRLSTVKNADQILVMDKGRIIESGNHQDLINQKGEYFNLVKNQLELEKVGSN